MNKKWYFSKTLWVNFIMLVAMAAASAANLEVPAELQGSVMVIVNFIMRFVTEEPIGK